MRRGRSCTSTVVVAACAVALALGAAPGWGQGIGVAPGEQGQLRADRVRYDPRAQVFTAEGNVHLRVGTLEVRAARLRLEQRTHIAYASGDVTVRQEEFSLSAADVTYEIRARIAHASGAVSLTQRDVTVRAPRITFAFGPQTLSAEGGVTAAQGGSTLSGQTLTANLQTRRAEVAGGAELIRAAQPATPATSQSTAPPVGAPTVIRAPRIRLRWDVNEAEASGGVTIIQGERTARAAVARYAEAEGRLELDGDVVLEQFGNTPPLSGARLTSRRLLLLLQDGTMEAQGNVTVTQSGRQATGERAEYSEREQRMVLIGRVRLTDEEGNVVRADRVIFLLSEETFEASGNVETIFRVRQGK